MTALQMMGEQGGWPLIMFLTPRGDPFWGGTCFPLQPRWGKPSFRQVLQGHRRRLSRRARHYPQQHHATPRAAGRAAG